MVQSVVWVSTYFICFAHTLVALKYMVTANRKNMRRRIIDGNRENNHYTNLRWAYAQSDILNSYKMVEGVPCSAKKTFTLIKTRIKMSNSKKQKVVFMRLSIRE